MRSCARRVGPPALAFAAARLLLLLAGVWSGQRPSDERLWMRWDSFRYAAIAEHGYEIHPCAPNEGVPGARWCGDAGWFPSYPALIRAAGAAGLSTVPAGTAISALAAFLSLVLLWNAFLIGRAGAGPSLLLASFFPGVVYQHAYFPMSLCVCGLLGLALAVRRGEAGWALLIAAATAPLHPMMAMLAPAALVAGLLDSSAPPRRRACWGAALGAGLGLILVLVVQHRDLGIWDGWARVQEMSRYRDWTPMRLRQMLYIPIVIHPTELTKTLVVAQSALVAALVLGAAAAAARRNGTPEPDVWLWSTTLVLWLAPHLSGYRQSYYRSETLLLPLAILAPRWPKLWRWSAAAAAAALAVLMAREFFAGRLV